MNCWEFMNCGDRCKTCPAHPDKGEDCWKYTGTMCRKKLEDGTFVEVRALSKQEKIEHCWHCEFYKQYAHKF